MTIEEFEKNKVRCFDSIRKYSDNKVCIGTHDCYGISCSSCIFNNDMGNCTIKNDLPMAFQKLQEWVDKHPIMTNRDKAKEVFGIEINYASRRHDCAGITCPNTSHNCTECKYLNFWSQEYHEPNAGEN